MATTRALRANDLCWTRNSIVPGNNGKLVRVTDADLARINHDGIAAPYRIRRVDAEPFAGMVNIRTGVESLGNWAWAQRRHLRKIMGNDAWRDQCEAAAAAAGAADEEQLDREIEAAFWGFDLEEDS